MRERIAKLKDTIRVKTVQVERMEQDTLKAISRVHLRAMLPSEMPLRRLHPLLAKASQR